MIVLVAPASLLANDLLRVDVDVTPPLAPGAVDFTLDAQLGSVVETFTREVVVDFNDERDSPE